jgi:hypothetical protein
MVVACLALFVASTGTSIAAGHYLVTSSKQIKPSVLAKLKGAKGPKGNTGATGGIGATGASGATNVHVRYAIGAFASGGAGTTSGTTAYCNTGEVATGGSVDWYNYSSTAVLVPYASHPSPSTAGSIPNGWYGQVINVGGTGIVQAEVFVICASP